MRDPYLMRNGVFKNKLGITDREEFKRAEEDISYAKMLNVEIVFENKFDIDLLKRIHKHVFGDIYEWAGKFRRLEIYKNEKILYGGSVEYAKSTNINRELGVILMDMNTSPWAKYDMDEKVEAFTDFIARIWKVHPFREGNTRTVLAFADIFARHHGFDLDISILIEDLKRIKDPETGEIEKWGLRDKLVLAALEERDFPEPQALEKIIREAIIDNGDEIKDNSPKDYEER